MHYFVRNVSARCSVSHLLVCDTTRPPNLPANLLFDRREEIISATVFPLVRVAIHTKIDGLYMFVDLVQMSSGPERYARTMRQPMPLIMSRLASIASRAIRGNLTDVVPPLSSRTCKRTVSDLTLFGIMEANRFRIHEYLAEAVPGQQMVYYPHTRYLYTAH